MAQTGAERGARMLQLLGQPVGERFGPMEAEHPAAASLGLKQICKAGFYPCAFVKEWQRPTRGLDGVRHALAVLRALELYPGQRRALPLSLNHADRRAVHEQEIIGLAMACFERKFAH